MERETHPIREDIMAGISDRLVVSEFWACMAVMASVEQTIEGQIND